MPHQESSHRFQKAVLWPFSSYDKYGEPVVGSPVEIDVRWENEKKNMRDIKGHSISIDANVVVDQVIVPGSNMWLGELADWYGTGSLGDDTNLMQVIDYRETPDVKGRAIRRIACLAKHKSQL